MFTITPAAAKQIKIAAEQGGTEGMALRMAVREKKDGSYDYYMGFDEPTDTDQRINSEGVEVIMDPSFEKYLEECTLDYVEMEDGSWQFVFLNPADPYYVPPKID
ncbi:MAG TPA: iron-sulfur cluster assembly accessory protein [Thiolapillus brandeum]|uniref:Iron-sulfur cluster assembly accessory protein n=1 Tax=Thiolapillus brandeum TaxID=1076588 RepID=A0A831KB54_9GAMM|nr:iron-sulfur cluster assembly accessory protein [Thiolapillus brandeum]